MKKLLPVLVLLVLAAAPAFAVEIGSKTTTDASDPRDATGIGRLGAPPNSRGDDGTDGPARPVPEPGTMALASMGLIALGAAARSRRK